MKKFSAILSLLILGGCADHPAASLSLTGSEGVIYGEDSIKDVTQPTLQTIRSVGIAEDLNLQQIQRDETYTVEELSGTTELSWGDQVTLPMCSGVALTDTTVLTAAHCLPRNEKCENLHVVPEYEVNGKDPLRAVRCKKVISIRKEFTKWDYAVLELEKSLNLGAAPLAILERDVEVGEELYVVGHPLGSLKKIAEGKVRRVKSGESIVATLDVFEGNSGSPVFLKKTHELVGILVRGADDFEDDRPRGSGRKVNRCSEDGCSGEVILPIQKILEDLKKKQ